MISGIVISRLSLSLVVATMYLAMSSTAIAHGLSHRSMSDMPPGSSVDGDCFFCYHGPALTLVTAPAPPVEPLEAYNLVNVIAAAIVIDAQPLHSPPLRAPPFFS